MAVGIEVKYERGIFLPELDLWLDPMEGKARAFVSHAHSDHFARHDWTICSVTTRRLIESRYGTSSLDQVVSLEWKQRIEDRGFEIRLLPAGHILGSAMLHLTRLHDGASLLYTGDFKIREGLLGEPAEFLTADTLIMETTFGLPRFRFPPLTMVVEQVQKFVRETLEDGGIPVLLGYTLGKAQVALSALKGMGVPVMLHNSMVKLTETYEKVLGVGSFPPWRLFHANEAAGHVLIFPPSASRSLALRKLKGCRTAMLSGWALTPGSKFRYQVDEVFPLSDHADYGELLDCVEQVSPKVVYTVHGSTREFANDLRQRGYQAWSLIAENQLEFVMLDLKTEDAGGQSTLHELVDDGPNPQSERVHEVKVNAFEVWARTAEVVASHSSRLKKQELLAEYLKKLEGDDLVKAVRWLAGMLDDPRLGNDALQVGWATIRQALMAVGGIREMEYRQIARSQNDLGRTAWLVLNQVRSRLSSGGSKSLDEVGQWFDQLRQARGVMAKIAVLKSGLQGLSAFEGSYVVRLLTGELRIGSREGLVEEAVAQAFSASLEQVREAAMLSGDIGRAALLAKAGKLEEAQPQLFVPVKVMLASPEQTAEEIWLRLTEGGTKQEPIWLEDKFDGIRAQVHVGRRTIGGAGKNDEPKTETEIFSRDLKRVTSQFPELVKAGGKMPMEVILDGEIIAYSADKKLTFHDLQRRLGRKEQGDFFVPSDVTVKYVVFDLLWKDGRSLLREPLEKRREQLEALPLPPGWQRISLMEADSPEGVEAAFQAARRAGNEGLIAKDRKSFYTPGRRGKAWLKLKKAFSTLDVVVVKAEQGHGKRSHVLSDYTFAVREERSGELKVIGKAYSGLTDAEIEELTIHFTEQTISQRGQVRTVRPDVVLEVAFDSIQQSRRHDSGLALRFPRIKAIRRDKTLQDIDTLSYARELAGLKAEV